jgi:ABC-type siderophore export system fused ATPase/permease subunit
MTDANMKDVIIILLIMLTIYLNFINIIMVIIIDCQFYILLCYESLSSKVAIYTTIYIIYYLN